MVVIWSHMKWNINSLVWFYKGREYTLSFFLGLLLWFTIIQLHKFINSWNAEKAFTCVILRTCQKNLANYKPTSNDTPTTLIFLLYWCGWTFCKVIIKHYRMPYTRTKRTWLLHRLSWFQLPLLSQWNRLLSTM